MVKIYDLTQIYNELDLLEIRLNILDHYVDFFVIGQSKQTFSGKDKPLYFNKWDARWEKWQAKIIPIEIPSFEGEVFDRTAFQKDYLRKGLENAQPEDIIFYGDCDEIYTPQVVGDKVYKLRQLNYCYYFNQRSSEIWEGTNVCKYKNLVNLNELRANHDNIIDNGGWHFTNQGGIDQVRKKIAAYDHQEMITDDVRDNLEQRILNGEDYLGRSHDWKGKPFEYWVDEVDLPKYLLDNREKYAANFR